MENRRRTIVWMACSLLSTFTILSMIQVVNAAPLTKSVEDNRRGSGDSQGKRLFVPKYMVDLYNVIADQYGNRRKGVSALADKIKCFLPGPSSDMSRNSLAYDIRDISKGETVIKAYLLMYKLRQTSAKNSTGFVQVDINDKRDGTPAVSRILNLRGGGWKSFELTTLVKRWHMERHNKYTILINEKDHRNSVFFAGHDNIERMPFLVVYSSNNMVTAKTNTNVAESLTGKLPKPDRGLRYKRGSNSPPCKRRSMIVDTTKIGWDSYVLAPRIFNAYRCEGMCHAYSSQAAKTPTNHAVLQAILAQLGTVQNGRPIRPPCCAPSQFENKTLLLHRKVKGQRVIGLEEFTDMVVKSCACL